MQIERESRVFEPPFVGEKLVHTLDELREIREGYRMLRKKVVLTQGVWDLLHIGHLRYIYAASLKGDIVIVGVDDDALTRARKGEGRPAVPQDERIQMLSFVPFIHHIALRTVEQDIGDLIRTVRPDVLVVSETTADFPEKDVEVYEQSCGMIVRLAEQARTSSTERLRQEAISGEAKGKAKVIDLLEGLIANVRSEL